MRISSHIVAGLTALLILVACGEEPSETSSAISDQARSAPSSDSSALNGAAGQADGMTEQSRQVIESAKEKAGAMTEAAVEKASTVSEESIEKAKALLAQVKQYVDENKYDLAEAGFMVKFFFISP